MLCPVCGNFLKNETIDSKDGGKLTVDHCHHCTGTWFGRDEIMRISSNGVTKLSYLKQYPQKPFFIPKYLDCPRDRISLEPYKSQMMGGDTGLYTCKKCLGVWAPQRSLVQFIQSRDKKETVSRSIDVIGLPKQVVPLMAALLIIVAASVWTISRGFDGQIPGINTQEPLDSLSVEQIRTGSVVMTVKTPEPVTTVLEYGIGEEDEDGEELVMSDYPRTLHQAVLKLPYRVTYWYRIKTLDTEGEAGETIRRTFTTGSKGELKQFQLQKLKE